MNLGQQTPGRVQLAVDKGRIEDQLGPLIGELRLPPVFDLALNGSGVFWMPSTPAAVRA
ncbi:MAG: hypothetical protein ACRD3P_06965 [Terriglobales bacterium]